MRLLHSILLVVLSFTMIGLPYQSIFTNQNKINSIEVDDLNDFTKSTSPGPITKSNPLNTSTVYNGETVYITIDNGTNIHISTTYTYNSINNITHNITFYDIGGIDDFCVFTPLSWNFTLIGSSHDITYDSTDECWIYSHVGIGSYDTFLFLSGKTYGVDYARQNRYMTLDDKSNDLLTDNSFESGFSDWTNTSFTSIEQNSTIYYNESNSLELIDSDGTTDILTLNVDLSPNYYYVSLLVFVDSFVGSNISLQHSNSGNWNDHLVNSTILDRWQQLIFYAHIDLEDGLRFVFNVGNGTVLIDLLELRVSNGLMVPSNTIHNYNVSSSVISLDLYKNFGISGETINYEIRERNDDIEINSTSLTTNSNGYSSYLYENKTLGLLEYEIKTWSGKNFPKDESFNTDLTETSEDLAQFQAGSGGTLSLSSNSQIGDYSIMNNRTTGDFAFLNPSYNPSFILDYSDVDFFYFWNYRIASGGAIASYQIRFETTGTDYSYVDVKTQASLNATWTYIEVNFDDFIEVGSPDISNVNRINFRMNIITQLGNYLLLDFEEPIKQKSFLQPRQTDQRDYFETIESDSVDFLEGDSEGITGGSIVITSGYLREEVSNVTITHTKGSLTINSDNYNHLSCRIKANASGSIQFQDSTSNLGTLQTVTTSYSLIEIDLSSNGNWSGIETAIKWILGITNIEYRIDFIQLYHENTPTFSQSYNGLQYWLNSENDTFTYYGTLISSETTSQNYVDITESELPHNGFYTFNYTPFKDSLYNSLLLPSSTYSEQLSLVSPNNDRAIFNWIAFIFGFMMFMGVFLLIMYFIIKVLWRIFSK